MAQNKTPAPTALEIIRTASRDCRAQDNSIAANELLDAVGIVQEMAEALERCRSLLVVAEGQFKGEFQTRVRKAAEQARVAYAHSGIAMLEAEKAERAMTAEQH